MIFTSDKRALGLARHARRFGRPACAAPRAAPGEGGFRVPAIAWMPGTVPGRRYNGPRLATTLDLFPTILGMSGADPGEYGGTGRNGRVAYLHRTTRHPGRGFSTTVRPNWWPTGMGPGSSSCATRTPGRTKTTRRKASCPGCSMSRWDPSEKHNVAAERPDVVERLTALAGEHERALVKVPSRIEGILPEFRGSLR